MVRLYNCNYSDTDFKLVESFKTINDCTDYLETKDTSPHNKYFNNGKDLFYYGKEKIWEIKNNEEN